MGHVYEAMDDALDCIVAIKETFASNDEQRRAFKREARLLANLRHPILPRVTHHFFEGEGQFLVMDYVEGDTLDALLRKRQRPFSYLEVLPWADKLLDALEYLHSFSEPIIHRDIKPSNVKLTEKGQLFLLDFGLAKGVAGPVTNRESGHQSVHGFTAAYAPLEQISRSGTNTQSDLYSLGATLYHLLTGQVPVTAADRYVQIEQDLSDPLLLAHQLNSGIDPQQSLVLSQAMAMRRKNRFATAIEMRRALLEAASGVAAEVVPSPPLALARVDRAALEPTIPYSLECPPVNLETTPRQEQSPLSNASSQNSWPSQIVEDGESEEPKSPSFVKNQAPIETVDNSVPRFSLLSSSTFNLPVWISSPNKRTILIAISTIAFLTLLAFLYNNIPWPSGDFPKQNDLELSQLTTDALQHVNDGTALKQQNRKLDAEKEFVQAESLYRRAVVLAPSNPQLHVSLASVHILRENWPEAIKEYQVAARLVPTNTEYQNTIKQLEAKKK